MSCFTCRCRHGWQSVRAALRAMSSLPLHSQLSATTMSAWQTHSYGDIDQLQLSTSLRVPPITGPNEVLVEVLAASVNPIDVRMLGGYGGSLLNVLRQAAGGISEFPLVLGRDFSGRVAALGAAVTDYRLGDEVWGALPVHWSGSHSQYTLAPSCAISLKPQSLTHTEAAALPYASATLWSALTLTAELCSPAARRGTRVLVLGASGGVGSLAVQLLKLWHCEVTATCASDSVAMVTELGADVVVDYTAEHAEHTLNTLKGFDVILDCSGSSSSSSSDARYLPLLKPWTYAKYVTLDPPLLSNLDRHGLAGGAVASTVRLVRDNVHSHREGRSVRWAFFMPNGCALRTISQYVDQGKIRPVVQRVLPFSDLPSAYQIVMNGHARGKTVLSMTS